MRDSVRGCGVGACMQALLILVIGYPVFLTGQYWLDRLTGWVIADAFGKSPPEGGEEN